MELLLSHEHDPYANLAFEERLLREGREAVFLWVNEPCVVIGRNQNPFHEADLKYLEEHGIALARRLSGGGAVFHDLGNLNYSLVSDGAIADRAAGIALAALKHLGIGARRTGRNDIVIGNAKIGGLAEYRAETCLEHGTLMVDVDLDIMQRALRPSQLKLGKHGVDSVRSRVANLSDIVRGTSIGQLVAAFEETLGMSARRAAFAPQTLEHARFLKGLDWLHGASPTYDAELERLVNGDVYRFEFQVRKGVIESARISTDACRDVARCLGELERQFEDLEFNLDAVDALICAQLH